MDALIHKVCAYLKGVTGCILPAGATWNCVTGLHLVPSCALGTQPTVNCCYSPTDFHVCVLPWVICECASEMRNKGIKEEGGKAHRDRTENLPNHTLCLPQYSHQAFL